MTLAAFAQGLLLPETVPLHLGEATDAGFAARFAIHRNNVRSARTEALRQGFPVLERLLGAEYFTALAGVFIQQHPPRSAVFHEYGAELADFIEAFPPLVWALVILTLYSSGSDPPALEVLPHPFQ